jgi:hypothetical protein
MAAPGEGAQAPVALVTGASSGIGYDLARLFARDGYRLVLLARDARRLEEVAAELRRDFGTWSRVLPMDLADPAAPAAVAETLQREGLALDVLVNNAGVGVHGLFGESEAAAQFDMLQINVVALTHLTRHLLPGMVARRRGKILNVASTAAFQPGPLMAVYYASKAYVLSFSEALANELRPFGVTVTALCPGMTRTKFQQRAGVTDIPLLSAGVMASDAVARAGYRALQRGRPVAIPGLRHRLLALAVRLLPRRMVVEAVRRIQEKRA